MTYSLILPVHNQADHIEDVLISFSENFKSKDFEIIVIENNSSDESLRICQEVEKKYPHLKVIHLNRPGWGNACINGAAISSNDFLIFASSARTTLQDIRNVIEATKQAPNSLIKTNRINRSSWVRKLTSSLYNYLIRIIYKINIKDVNGTPKVINRKIFESLSIQSQGDSFDLELIYKCNISNIKIKEIHSFLNKRHGGKSTTNFHSAIKMFFGIFSVKSKWEKNEK